MNLAIANRSRVSCAHDTLRASIGIKIAIGTPDEPTAPAVSWCQQSEDSDERRSLMSAAGCQTGTPVPCHAHNGTPEHTTGTGFAPGRVTSETPVAVELCALTSGTSR